MSETEYHTALSEQDFWTKWGPSLKTLLGDDHYQQLGVDLRAVLRTQWWEWRQANALEWREWLGEAGHIVDTVIANEETVSSPAMRNLLRDLGGRIYGALALVPEKP
jgi:hypothetical protein